MVHRFCRIPTFNLQLRLETSDVLLTEEAAVNVIKVWLKDDRYRGNMLSLNGRSRP
ncbi:MAG: hypothetical protein IJU76_05050 [Desulfovibrionaceae bacterium]|nr:hypothetical protein [Desulfovibrionaceae bacterium]